MPTPFSLQGTPKAGGDEGRRNKLKASISSSVMTAFSCVKTASVNVT